MDELVRILGELVIDAGNPFGPASTIVPNGRVADGGSSSLTGYSIISASSLDEACEKAKGCPLLSASGSVEIYEGMPIG